MPQQKKLLSLNMQLTIMGKLFPVLRKLKGKWPLADSRMPLPM